MILRCCGMCDKESLPIVQKSLERFTRQSGIQIEGEWFQEQSDLYHQLSTRPGQIVLVAYPGALGMESITHAQEILADAILVWFSDDRHFALHSWRLRAASFDLLPVTEEKVIATINRCVPLFIEQVTGKMPKHME